MYMASLSGDKVSMLTHTYPYKLVWKIKMTSCNNQADNSSYMYVAWYLTWWFANIEKRITMHGTEYPYRDQISFCNV